MSEIDLFIKMRPQIKVFAEDIGESLAINYRKGLGPSGHYQDRLNKGVEIATQAKSNHLIDIINTLLKDRENKGARTVINIPKSESGKRALILGLWSSRPVNIGRQDKIQLKSSQVYGNAFYIPPVDLGTDLSEKIGTNNKKTEHVDSDKKDNDNKKFDFDLNKINDERKKTFRLISQRQGQASFRNRLKESYNNRCIITGCDAVEALEAAHIIPYLGDHTNIASNGLLLRSDVHNLFDLGLITIDADEYRVIISDRLKGTTYEELSMKQIKLPASVADYPDKGALKWHRNEIFDR